MGMLAVRVSPLGQTLKFEFFWSRCFLIWSEGAFQKQPPWNNSIFWDGTVPKFLILPRKKWKSVEALKLLKKDQLAKYFRENYGFLIFSRRVEVELFTQTSHLFFQIFVFAESYLFSLMWKQKMLNLDSNYRFQ